MPFQRIPRLLRIAAPLKTGSCQQNGGCMNGVTAHTIAPLVAPYCAIPRDYLHEPRKGGFSKGGFCRVQGHAQGNKKYPKVLGAAVHLALTASRPREASKKPLFLVPDISPIARYGVFGVSTWLIGCDAPSPSAERFPIGEHAMKWRCDANPQKWYLGGTCAIPYENKENACDTPYLERVLRDMGGGISHWAAKIAP